jgi:hypothetical protein
MKFLLTFTVISGIIYTVTEGQEKSATASTDQSEAATPSNATGQK